MNAQSLQKKLVDLPLGRIRYFETIGSSNDEALAWAATGAPDLSIVIADEQTSGRGRLNRKWFTPKGTALAFSLVLRSPAQALLSRSVGLAALSVADALLKYRLPARIKWPNDILLNRKKVAGILIETVWAGVDMDSLVIGIGINIQNGSVPPIEDLQFPTTSVEGELGRPLDREEFLHHVLSALVVRRPQMDTDHFMKSWEDLLAFRGEQVQVRAIDADSLTGELLGIDSNGGLRLRGDDGQIVTAQVGDVSLRPVA